MAESTSNLQDRFRATSRVAIVGALVNSVLAVVKIVVGVVALVALGVGGWAMARKARQAGVRVSKGAGRRFVLNLSPPLVAAALLTVVLYRAGAVSFAPSLTAVEQAAAVAIEATLEALHGCKSVETVVFACFSDEIEAALKHAAAHHAL